MESAALMKRASCSVALLLLASCFSSAALAAPVPLLSANTSSYDDPNWRGIVNFFDSSGSRQLSGTIEYAVFTAAAFNADYPLNPQPGAMVYAYQIFVDNTTNLSDISHFSLGFITDPSASNMTFVPSPPSATPLIGVAPTSFSHDTQAADWFFNNTIQPNQYSQILVYSSPYLPTMSTWTVNDGGLTYSQSGTTNQLPVPGSTPAPEPGTATLLCLAGLFGAPVLIRRIRRRQS